MADNHYEDIINGCPGGQFAEPAAFALWTVCPCLRSPVWGHILRLPFYLLLIAGLLGFLCCLMIGFVCIVAFLPFTGLYILIKCCKSDSFSESKDTIMLPGFIGGALSGGILLLVLTLIWLPVGVIITLIGFPVHLCINCNCSATCKFFFNCCDDDDGIPSAYFVWFMPVAILMSSFGGRDD